MPHGRSRQQKNCSLYSTKHDIPAFCVSRLREVNETPLSTSQTRGEPDGYSGIQTDGSTITTPRHTLAPGVVLMPGRRGQMACRACDAETYLFGDGANLAAYLPAR